MTPQRYYKLNMQYQQLVSRSNELANQIQCIDSYIQNYTSQLNNPAIQWDVKAERECKARLISLKKQKQRLMAAYSSNERKRLELYQKIYQG